MEPPLSLSTTSARPYELRSSSSSPRRRTFPAYPEQQSRRGWRWLDLVILFFCLSALFLVPILFLYGIHTLVSPEQLQTSTDPELLDEEETPQSLRFQVEILAGCVVALQFLQFLMCRARFQRSDSWFFHWAAWVSYYLPVPLAAYAVGMMLRFPCPYWLVAVFFAAGYSDSMAAFTLQEDKKNVRRFAKRALCLAYLLVALVNGTPCKHPLEILSILLGFLVFLVDLGIGLWATIPCSELCMMAAEYLVRCQLPETQTTTSTTTQQLDRRRPDRLEVDLETGGLVIAVGSRRYYEGAVFGCTTYKDISDLDTSQDMKDVCISSGLFIQLLQRSDETPQLDRSGVRAFFRKLLEDKQDPHYARAFKIVEVQLAFLYDYFFCSRGSPSRTSYKLYTFYSCSKMCFLLSVLGICIADNAALVARLCFACPILLELCLNVDYLISNWLLVSYMCAYARDKWYLKVMPVVLRIASSVLEAIGCEERRWPNMLGQYSLVEDFLQNSRVEQLLRGQVRWHPGGPTPANPVALSDGLVKTQVAKIAIHQAQAGMSAFDVLSTYQMEDGSVDDLSWTLDQRSEVRTILIWHIATRICERLGDANQSDYSVATKLSRYCAYLVAFCPELLPWQHADAIGIFDEALKEGKLHCKGKTSMGELYETMADISGALTDQSILKQGIKLGQHLTGAYKDSERWKRMASFWTHMVIIMAQWGNFEAHIEHLARGGEFLTHIWALLSNAGIETDRTFIKRSNKYY